MKKLNLQGKIFGKLKVIKCGGKNKRGEIIWECLCECGNKTFVVGAKLNNGHTKSCGCLVKENHYIKHDKTGTRIYRIWNAMKNRCYNKKTLYYKDYGGRGIIVYEKWLNKENGFMNFYNWSILNGYDDNLTIDRIDVNGNYEPSNCRWVDKKEQSSNTRKTTYYEFNKEKHTIKEWSEILNINYNTLRSRILELNWSIEKSLTKGVINDKN